MTLDEQLTTTYNTSVIAFPTISSHWRKFKRWSKDVVLHGNSGQRQHSREFTTASQRFSEDPNQFYLRLFNLGIQSGRRVDTEDFITRLVQPLQDLIGQHDRTYPTIQDAVAHAGRLWIHIDVDKVQREYREEKDRLRRQKDARDGRQRDSRVTDRNLNRKSDSAQIENRQNRKNRRARQHTNP